MELIGENIVISENVVYESDAGYTVLQGHFEARDYRVLLACIWGDDAVSESARDQYRAGSPPHLWSEGWSLGPM